jgi:serine/threonine-protein kinase
MRTLFDLWLFGMFALSVVFARRNLRAGRADVRGAVRLSLIMGVIGFLGFGLLAQPHIPMGQVFTLGVMMNLFFSAFYATSYLALEPIVRRSNPEWLVSWTRLLTGRWQDPLVGRDVLIGASAGVFMCLLSGIRGILERSVLFGDFQAAALGGFSAIAVVLRGFSSGVLGSLMWVLMFVLLRVAVRRPAVAWAIWFPIALGVWSGPAPSTAMSVISVAVILIAWALVLKRSGLLGGAAAITVYAIFNEEYVTTQFGAWYAGVTIAGLVAVGLLLAWGVVAVTGWGTRQEVVR